MCRLTSLLCDVLTMVQFLCALPPSLRPAWSKRMAELLSPGGRLVCLEFPTYKEPSAGGPPFAMPSKLYRALLSRPGEVISYDQNGEFVEEQIGGNSGKGLQQIAHFQPRRTHPAGLKDGEVTDRIGVWAHPQASNRTESIK